MNWALSAGCLVTAGNPITNGTIRSSPAHCGESERIPQGQSRFGCAKLYLIVKRLFDENDNMPGRDAFIELLRKKRLDGKAEATQTL